MYTWVNITKETGYEFLANCDAHPTYCVHAIVYQQNVDWHNWGQVNI